MFVAIDVSSSLAGVSGKIADVMSHLKRFAEGSYVTFATAASVVKNLEDFDRIDLSCCSGGTLYECLNPLIGACEDLCVIITDGLGEIKFAGRSNIFLLDPNKIGNPHTTALALSMLAFEME